MGSFVVIIEANNRYAPFHCELYKFSSCYYTKLNMVDPIFYFTYEVFIQVAFICKSGVTKLW